MKNDDPSATKERDAANLADAPAKRVLFVDADQKVLDSLKKRLDSLRTEWLMAFSTSGPEALEQLAATPFDVVVTRADVAVAGGSDLLTEVLQRFPDVVRIVLTDTVELDVVRSATAHQYLVQSSNGPTLKSTLDRALQIRGMLAHPGLRALVSRIISLPSLPAVHTQLIASLDNPELSSRELGDIIAQDVAMTAKILQISNSAFFGLYRYVASPAEAAVYLGVDTIRALALSTGAFTALQTSGLAQSLISQLQHHSTTTGVVAAAIGKAENLPKKVCDSAMVGGLLHDVGKLVLAANCPEEYEVVLNTVKKDGVACYEVERQMFGATHADIGAYLLYLWALPDLVCKAVAFHHGPADYSTTTFTAAAAIHAADALEHELTGVSDFSGRVAIDMNYCTLLGLAGRVPEWRRLCKKQLDKEEVA
jgi:HD-like signal output (HDOD) protein/precorrin-6B methylase 2